MAHGYTQELSLEHVETFSYVMRHTTVRSIISLVAHHRWKLRQLDIKNALLHGDLEEEVYMKPPQGFVDQSQPDHVCKLVQSLYGLKQAPRAWNSKFTGYLPAMGFQMSQSDNSLFVKYDGTDAIALLLYVDDIILIGSSSTKVQPVIQELGDVFELKDMGKLSYIMGLQIQYKDNGVIFVNQSKYAKDLIYKAGKDTCKPTSTPCKPHTQLLASDGSYKPYMYISIST